MNLLIDSFISGFGLYWLAAFIHVFLRSFQQQNVIFNNYLLIIPISYGMFYIDTYITEQVATHGADAVWFACGTGGWLGCWTSMWIHRRVRG